MLEVIAVTPDEARIAEGAGAGRIELVSALSEGGLTPGIGLVRRTVRAVAIPVNVMVRPHSRGFHYSADDLAVMGEEIRAIRAEGANGVVLGVLDERGRVHEAQLERLLAEAEGLQVTFHRAIDASADPLEASRILGRCAGLHSILTSGGPGPIEAHTDLLARMREAAHPRRILAGSGVTAENLAGLIRSTGLRDWHIGTAARQGGRVDGPVDAGRVALLAGLLWAGGLDPLA